MDASIDLTLHTLIVHYHRHRHRHHNCHRHHHHHRHHHRHHCRHHHRHHAIMTNLKPGKINIQTNFFSVYTLLYLGFV